MSNIEDKECSEARLRKLVTSLQSEVKKSLKHSSSSTSSAAHPIPILVQYPPANEKTPITEIGVIVDDLHTVSDLINTTKINPPDNLFWLQARTYKEFEAILETRGIPHYVSFDGSLDNVKLIKTRDGHDCARLLLEYCAKADRTVLPICECHSVITTKKQQIEMLILDYNPRRYKPNVTKSIP